MSTDDWEALFTDTPKSVVPRDGQRLRLLTAVLYEMHVISPILLDHLERVYTEYEKSGLTRQNLRFAMEAFTDPNHELRQTKYSAFWVALVPWLEAIRIDLLGKEGANFIDIVLSVVSSPGLDVKERSVSLKDALLQNFAALKREIIVEGAEIYSDISPPNLPPFNPLLEDETAYLRLCQHILKQHLADVIETYTSRAAERMSNVRQETFHIRLMAAYLVRGVSVRKLADALIIDPAWEGQEGLSHNNISVALGKLSQRMGVQVPEFP